MLTGLDTIPWSDVSAACRSAAHFPRFLPDLTSPDPLVFERGLEQVFYQSIHQYTIYPVTPVIVPFLIQAILLQPSAHQRATLLTCVTDLAWYGALRLDPPWEVQLPRPDHRRAYRDLEQQCYAAARPGCAVAIGELCHPSEAVRAAAGRFLALFPEAHDTTLPAFMAALATDLTLELRADLLRQLAELCLRCQRQGAVLPRSITRALAAELTAASPDVRWAATCASILLGDGQPCPAGHLEQLCSVITAYAATPDDDRCLQQYCDLSEVCTFLPLDQRLTIAIMALCQLTRPSAVYGGAERLLNDVFVHTVYSTTRGWSNTMLDHAQVYEHTAFSDPAYEQAFAQGAAAPTAIQRQVVQEVAAAVARHGIQSNLLAFCGLTDLLG